MAALDISAKRCSRCKETKSIECFARTRAKKCGRSSYCNECQSAYMKAWVGNPDNASRVRESRRAVRARNRSSDKSAINQAGLAEKTQRAIKPKKSAAERYLSQREQNRRYSASERGRELARIRRSRIGTRLINRIRASIYGCLRQNKNWVKTADIVDWTVDQLRVHLERQFVDGMNWNNMGEWHIDHIVPIASFKLDGNVDDPALRRVWALTNLRPLWASENQAKRDNRIFLI